MDIPVPFMLKPNRKFIIGVIGSQANPLTRDEKDEIITALADNENIINLVNSIGQQFLNSKVLDIIPAIETAKTQFYQIAKQSVSQINKNYRLKPIDNSKLDALDTFITDLVKIKNSIFTIKNSEIVKNKKKGRQKNYFRSNRSI
ncbi:MAG: hypothetical protein M0P47_12495 [Bacteroidales bacterium]|nr:hypothetical protein [Bacteroidales bacterium]